MYQSGRDQLLQAKKESANKKRIAEDVDQMIRNKMIMQGLTPISIDLEAVDISSEKDIIMEALKRITIQPTRFYKYLFDTNQLELFSMGIERFIRKYLKYRKNMPYDSLVSAWEHFKLDPTNRVEKLVTLQRENLMRNELESSKNIVEEERIKRGKLGRIELEQREGITRGELTKEQEKSIEYFNRVKRNLLNRIKKESDVTKTDKLWAEVGEIERKKKQVLNPTPQLTEEEKEKMQKRQERINSQKKLLDYYTKIKSDFIENLPNKIEELRKESPKSPESWFQNVVENRLEMYDRDIDRAKKDLDELMSGSGIKRRGRKGKHPDKSVSFNNTRLVIDPTKMARKAMYPVNRNWSWM